jgi:hypothetical protein
MPDSAKPEQMPLLFVEQGSPPQQDIHRLPPCFMDNLRRTLESAAAVMAYRRRNLCIWEYVCQDHCAIVSLHISAVLSDFANIFVVKGFIPAEI